MATRNRVIVVGAGIGGLTAALELAARGAEVVLLEAAAQPGGKMRQVEVSGRPQDAGPTVFTMRWVFDELFAAVGSSLAEHLELHPIGTLARHAWSGSGSGSGSEPARLDLHADLARSADAISAFAGPAQGRGYLAFCERAQGIYRTLERPFLRASRPNPLSLTQRIGLRGLPDLWRIAPFATLWQALGQHFQDSRLRQLFGRYATYCGSSPFQAPATLMLVAHVEQAGVWQVEGGMHCLATALAGLAQQHGAVLRYGAQATQVLVRSGRASGVRLSTGEVIEAGSVVFNGDVAALAGGLLGDAVQAAVPATGRTQRSLSAITWNVVGRTGGFPLLHHTVFFSDDYAAEFKDLASGRVPGDPTVYVCAQDRREAEGSAVSDLPQAGERLLCLVNAPPCGDEARWPDEALADHERRMGERLARCGLDLQREPGHTLVTTPADFHRLFPATGGALYGAASHGWQASFSRPGARSRLPGLYLAGGSTHPGPGVPMAALSGRQAAASWLADAPKGSR